VSTESAEIIEMLNSEFNALPATKRPTLDLCPPELSDDIDEVNAVTYPSINDGVYRCGFSSTQEAYENAHASHWKGMDAMKARLGKNRFLCGEVLTLADVRLFPSLVRYDAVYFSHFKTARNQLETCLT
jgi:putative glutathione S-transferase